MTNPHSYPAKEETSDFRNLIENSKRKSRNRRKRGYPLDPLITKFLLCSSDSISSIDKEPPETIRFETAVYELFMRGK